MSTTTNYSAVTPSGQAVTRKVDLYIMGDLNFGSSTLQKTAPSLSVDTGGKVCAGLAKLAQKTLLVLLSYSIYYDFDWGTGLYRALLSGNFTGLQRNLGPLLAAYIDIASRQIISAQTSDMPPDETLFRLQMNEFTIDRANQKIILSLSVVSNSKDVTTIVVPITVVP